MYVVVLKYVKPLAELDRLLTEHRAFLDRQYAAGLFLASGAQVPRTGGVILAKACERAHLEAVLREDPFHEQGCAEYQVIEFTPTKRQAGLEKWLE